MTRNSLVRLFAVLAITASACSGDDGATGAQGPQGPAGADGAQGPQGPGAPTVVAAQVETCVVCHGDGKAAGVDVSHAVSGVLEVKDIVAVADATTPTTAVLTFKIEVDGVASDAYVKTVSSRTSSGVTTWTSSYYYDYNPATGLGVRTGLTGTTAAEAGDKLTVESLTGGEYRVTIPNGLTAGAARTFMVRLNAGEGAPEATVVANVSGTGNLYVTGTDQACINCHGLNVFPGGHHSANPQGVGACVVCHVTNSISRGTAGDRLKAYVHGIHNSHNMPDGVYSRNDSTSASSQFEVSFPANMNNCSTCHDTDASLAKVLAAPVTFSTCMSCHDSWDSFERTKAAGTYEFHRAYTAATAASECAVCHNGTIAFDTAGDVHGTRKDVMTERNGLLWKGVDQSIVEGAKIVMKIVEVQAAGADSELRVKWTAEKDGVAVDPCNTDIAAGPVFFGATVDATKKVVASNMSILRAYAQGNDWTNAGVGTSPGQPGSATNLAAANTTCSANVATTISKVDATTAAKGIVALQGKPQVWFADAGRAIQVRAKSPTREFVVADGSLPTELRRQIVSIDKCLACHPGTLYQHGGNRVDSIELCVMCHNPASSEQNVREAMGVTAEEAYDGKAGQTYDLRYMVHAIHSAGETGTPLVYYRNNGLYLWGSELTAEAIASWPGAGNFVVAGSNNVEKNHNFHAVTYPRALNDCKACHISDATAFTVPDGSKSVGVTVNSGASIADQQDDTVMGAVAATCTSCHAFAPTRAHAYEFGWTPSVFEGGRQALIDAAK